ncbi:MAG: alpha/beta fold hydrolase [Acidobacteriota bacterium]|nr:alpha/beta fold hydrolase [Acidobacteriota bacterium]
MNATRVFIHGLESSGNGAKGVFFRKRYPDMIIKDYFGSFQERMGALEQRLAGKSGLILVGSSYGGLMAATYACLHAERVDKLILLAPALHLAEFEPCLGMKIRIPVTIFHGNNDEVVPLSAVRRIAEGLCTNLTFNIVEDDHSLHETFATYDWDALLSI